MNRQVARIERIAPRKGVVEEPLVTARGYRLADPAQGGKRHHAALAVHVRSLEEVARLVGRGHCLWMTAKGKRPSLIAPQGLRILWRDEPGAALTAEPGGGDSAEGGRTGARVR